MRIKDAREREKERYSVEANTTPLHLSSEPTVPSPAYLMLGGREEGMEGRKGGGTAICMYTMRYI